MFRASRDRFLNAVVAGSAAVCLVAAIAASLSAATRPRPPRESFDEPSAVAPSNPPPGNPPPGNALIPVRPGFLINVAVNRADAQYSRGERLSVKFRSEREAFVYLLYHQADGRTALIFPNQAQKDNRVAARADTTFPKAGDGFRFRVSPPFGEEALQVIASLEKIELLDQLRPEAARAAEVPAATLAEVAGRIRAAAEKYAEHRIVIQTRDAGGPLTETPPAERFGLFIGVNRLQDSTFGKEHEAVRGSAKLMHEMMTQLGGVAPERARLLTDQQATLANIQSAVTDWLVKATRPGDTVFLFYCGHGGQVKAVDETEPDGLDEFFSVYDSAEQRLRETVITDDRLARWLQELPGRQIVLLMEACHSGGLIDGRGVAQAMADEANRLRDVCQLNTVIVTACLPDEQSIFDASKKATTMPLLLLDAATRLPRPLSVESAFRHYARRVSFLQEPTLTDHALLPIVLIPGGPARPPH